MKDNYIHCMELFYDEDGYRKNNKFIKTDFIVLLKIQNKHKVNMKLLDYEEFLKNIFVEKFGAEEFQNEEYMDLDFLKIIFNSRGFQEMVSPGKITFEKTTQV